MRFSLTKSVKRSSRSVISSHPPIWDNKNIKLCTYEVSKNRKWRCFCGIIYKCNEWAEFRIVEHATGVLMSRSRTLVFNSYGISAGEATERDGLSASSRREIRYRDHAVSGFCGNGRLQSRNGKYRGRCDGNLFRRSWCSLLDVGDCVHWSQFCFYGVGARAGLQDQNGERRIPRRSGLLHRACIKM